MKSYTAILVDYYRATSQANKLDSLAAELRSVSKNKLNSTLTSLASEWQGDSSTIFRRKGEELGTDIDQTARKMEQIADAIRTSAKRIRDADLRALEIAKKRNS